MNTLLRNDKPKKSAGFDAENTLMRIETNTVMYKAKKKFGRGGSDGLCI